MRFNSPKISMPIFFLLLISLLFLGYGLLQIQFRWINPDEGAHLTDATFLLQGKIPYVDYQSREPLYVLLMALFLKIFGLSLSVGRLLPLLTSTGTGILLYLLSQRLFRRPLVGLLTALSYYLLPLTITFATVAKTENIAIFFSTLSVFLISISISGQQRYAIFLAGFGSALAYYIRGTNLATFVALALFLILFHGDKIKVRLQNLGLYLLGYLVVVVGTFSIYAPFMSLRSLINSSLNPGFPFFKALLSFYMGLTGKKVTLGSTVIETFRLPGQSVDRTITELLRIFDQNMFLFIGILISVGLLGYFYLKEKDKWSLYRKSFALLYCWFFIFFIFYGYYSFQRGFFPQYFTELIPPALVLSVISLYEVFVKLEAKNPFYAHYLFWVFLSFLIFILYRVTNLPYPIRNFYLVEAIGFVLLIIYGIRYGLRKGALLRLYLPIIGFMAVLGSLFFINGWRWVFDGWVWWVVFIALIFIIFSKFLKINKIFFKYKFQFVFIFAVFYSSLLFSMACNGFFVNLLKYDCVWSPQALKRTVTILKRISSEDEEVLSGGMIWSFQAHRQPFMRFSHPLAYVSGIDPERQMEIRAYLRSKPPPVIILDGFTERSYLQVGSLKTLLEEAYVLEEVLGEKDNPENLVRVYRLRGLR